MKIIALCSDFARSGKDSLCWRIKDVCSGKLTVVRLAFADELKKQLLQVVPNANKSLDKDWSDPELSIEKLKEGGYKEFLKARFTGYLKLPRSYRWHCKQFGTEYMRKFKRYDECWVHYLEGKLNKARAEGADLVVITDLREKIELRMLSEFTDVHIVKVVPIGLGGTVHEGCKFEANLSYKNIYGYSELFPEGGTIELLKKIYINSTYL